MEEKYNLEIDDLVSNLFIILWENDCKVNEVTYKQIMDFGDILCEEAILKNMKICLILDREETNKFLYYNSDNFTETDNSKGIRLNEGVTPIHLIADYRGHLRLKVLLLMVDDEIVNKTLSMMGYNKTCERVEFNIDEYINNLETMIKEYANKMEFEKCIDLRDKLYRLYDEDKKVNNNYDRPIMRTLK